MKSSNRFLFGFGIGLAGLVVLTILLVIFSGRQVATYPENTPEGVVQHFLQSVQTGDYPKAYSYTQVVENGNTLTVQDLMPYVPSGNPTASWRATLGKITTTDNTSMVEVIVDRLQPQGPFGNPVSTQTVVFNLTKINGTWYITQRPPVYLLY
jgi:hypothetical protein